MSLNSNFYLTQVQLKREGTKSNRGSFPGFNIVHPFLWLSICKNITSENFVTNLKGFNGQEKDREIYNNENTTTALFWEYDGRIGRRWNVDPVMKEWESSYLTFSANPIFNVDIKGNNAGWYVDNKTGDVIGKDKKDDDNVFVVEKESDKQKIKDDNFQNGVDQSELKGESVRVPTFTGRNLQKRTEERGRNDNTREYANTLSVGVGSLRQLTIRQKINLTLMTVG